MYVNNKLVSTKEHPHGAPALRVVSTQNCQNISNKELSKYEKPTASMALSIFFYNRSSYPRRQIRGKNQPRARVTNRNMGLVINLHEFQFYLLSCMVFLRCNAAGALITTLPPRNMMKKLFPAISSCNINYGTRKVPHLTSL